MVAPWEPDGSLSLKALARCQRYKVSVEETKRSLGLLGNRKSHHPIILDEGGLCHKNEEKEGTNHGSKILGHTDWLEIHSSIGKSSGQTVQCPENYVCRRGRVGWYLFGGGLLVLSQLLADFGECSGILSHVHDT